MVESRTAPYRFVPPLLLTYTPAHSLKPLAKRQRLTAAPLAANKGRTTPSRHSLLLHFLKNMPPTLRSATKSSNGKPSFEIVEWEDDPNKRKQYKAEFENLMQYYRLVKRFAIEDCAREY